MSDSQPCVGSADSGTLGIQPGRGGATPTPTLTFAFGRDREAAELVEKFHYSRRVPSNVQLICTAHLPGGLFGRDGEAVAAAYFTIPGTRWGEPVMELARLVRKNGDKFPLSKLVGFAVRRMRTLTDLLVSFADKTQGHTGYIYQACGWNYDGARERRMDGVVWGGHFIAGRACNHQWGTRSPRLLAERGIVVEPHYDEGKHLYWLALSDAGEAKAGRLGLKREKYPKGVAVGGASDLRRP